MHTIIGWPLLCTNRELIFFSIESLVTEGDAGRRTKFSKLFLANFSSIFSAFYYTSRALHDQRFAFP